VARELDVRYVLEGSVRKAGDRLRITTRLVDGTSGGPVWAHRYDRSADDIIALQDEIAKAIVDILKVKLLPGELETITQRATASAAAYEYYLIGRSFYLRGIDRRSLTIARGLFAKAIEFDPNYARAYAGAAICDSYLTMSDTSASFGSTLAKVARARVGSEPGRGLCGQGDGAVRRRPLRRRRRRVRTRSDVGPCALRSALLLCSQLPPPGPS
jgi:adenylate cyclase